MSIAMNTREGSVNVLGSIASFLHGYSGEITIVRELVQNADDAPGEGERWIEFDLRPDALIVRNNSVFSGQDFENIADIAHQGKRLAGRRAIGRFGIGFVSVYQLTDTPIIRSSGHQWVMRPTPNNFSIDDTPSDIIDYTEFELPYRFQATQVGDLLDMTPISSTQLTGMRSDLPDEAERLLFFLRRLSRIRICESGQLVREVWREIKPATDPYSPEQLTVHSREANGNTWSRRWLRFTGKVPYKPAGHALRDEAVHIVIPDRGMAEQREQSSVNGRLYNYLPTEILTGLPFHVNGDFIPTTDRKGIDNDHDDRAVWNQLVIDTLGTCLAEALPTLLEHFRDDPDGLYRRLPLARTPPLLSPVVEAFFNAARELPILATRLGWRRPSGTFVVGGGLRPLLTGIDLPVMEAHLEAAARVLLERLMVPSFTLQHLVARWKEDIAPGTLLAEGPSYLREPEHIQRVYANLERDFAQAEQELLREAPIFLDHQGKLWPSTQCVRCGLPDVRNALAESGLHFWAPGTQLYLAQLVPDLTLSRVVTALRTSLPQETPLKEAPLWMNSTRKLFAVYRALLSLRHPGETLRGIFDNLPICIDREERLCIPRLLRMPGAAPVLYEILAADLEPRLALKTINDDLELRQFFFDIGVTSLDVVWLVDRLARLAGQQPRPLDQTHPCLDTREKLLRIYRFLGDHVESSLGNAELQTLRHRTAIWLCQDGKVRLARDVYAPPSAKGWPQEVIVDDLLEVGSQDRLGRLLERLEIPTLDDARFIIDKLLPQLPMLNDRGYWSALKYLQTQLPLLHSRSDLAIQLKEAEIFYDDDRRLARAVDLCYPTKDAQAIFGAHMRVPQIKRYFGNEVPADQNKWPWHGLFQLLELNPFPPGSAVLRMVKMLRGMPVHEARDDSERLFRYLERHWESYYHSARITSELSKQPWLPADGDDTQFYRPCDLFPRQERALLAHTKKILGFRDARRPQGAIAKALGMPSVYDKDERNELRYAHLVVDELLYVCKERDLDHPPDDEIYRFLDQQRPKGSQGLARLRGKAVVYEKDTKRYWKPEQIFLENCKAEFGDYRGYALNHRYAGLLEDLGARKRPQISDYRDVVREIAERVKGPVPTAEQTILKQAYTALAGAQPHELDVLRHCACVLTQPAGELSVSTGERLLRLPEEAVLQPSHKIQRVLPMLPVARYDPAGETALRELGVRSLEALLDVQLSLVAAHGRATTINGDFAGLGSAIRRLFYHTSTQHVEEREARLWEKIKATQAFELPAITVTYAVKLGASQLYDSAPQDETIHYTDSGRIIYLRAGLSREERISGLADMLGQLLDDKEHGFSLLRDLLREPGGAEDTLDLNDYRRLPASLTTVPIDTTVGEFWIGAPINSTASATDIAPPEPDDELFPPVSATPSEQGSDGNTPTGVPPFAPRLDRGGSTNAGSRLTVSRQGGGNGIVANGRMSSSTDPSNGTPPVASGPKMDLDMRPRSSSSPLLPPGITGASPRPAFNGIQDPHSPLLSTDAEGLLDRTRRWAEARPQPVALPPATPTFPRSARKGINPAEPRQEQIASFTLSFAEVNFGFLRLHQRARGLFSNRSDRVRCVTDSGQQFTLWLDWSRKPPIAYAQPELGQYFANEEIPAGGIVYLERRHSDYRLYYNEVPHLVREVRIAWNDQGRVTYEVIDAVEVKCETVDAVYRAEKRFEDKTALWLEAANKKSVLETLCDLFMASDQVWLHEDDLTALVMAERMLSADTVRQCLRTKECFDEDGDKSWRFVPEHLERALQRDPFALWHRATAELLRADTAILVQNLPDIRQRLVQVSERLREVEQQKQLSGGGGDVSQLAQRILAEPENSWPLEELGRIIEQQIEGSRKLADDLQLRETLEVIGESALIDRLRPRLRTVIHRLREEQKFVRVVDLSRLWTQFDAEIAPELDRHRIEADAWKTITGDGATAVAVAQALAPARGIPGGLAKLQRALYRDLEALPVNRWLDLGGGAASVNRFYEDISDFSGARDLLPPNDQKAFDEAVLNRVRGFCDKFDEVGRIGLIVLLPSHAPRASLLDHQIEFLRFAAKKCLGTAPLEALLVSRWAFKHTTDMHRTLRRELADLLATSHRQLKIWELSQKQPWLQWLDELQRRNINSEAIRNEPSRQQRIASLLDAVDQLRKSSVIALWLHQESVEFAQMAEQCLSQDVYARRQSR